MIIIDSDFFEEWLPKALREAYPSFESALQRLETRPNPEAATVAFWMLVVRWHRLERDSRLLKKHNLTPLTTEERDDVLRSLGLVPALFPERRTVPNEERDDLLGILSRQSLDSEDARSLVDRLDRLMEDLRPSGLPDEPLKEFDVWTYAHVAATFATCLQLLERAQTERYWEAIENAARVLQRPNTARSRPWADETEFPSELEVSSLLVDAFLQACLFNKYHRSSLHERALESLFRASEKCIAAYDVGRYVRDPWEELSTHFGGRFKAYEDMSDVEKAGLGLLSAIVPAQDAVDSFEEILRRPPQGANWQDIARWCEGFGEIWKDDDYDAGVQSDTIRKGSGADEGTSAGLYWVFAQGLAVQKMEPVQLWEHLEKSRNKANETRLRLYFFGDLWDRLPEKAQQALISADREYEDPHGRRPIVLDHLREAARSILVQRIMEPFAVFLRSSTFTSPDSLKAVKNPDRDLAIMLLHWPTADFQTFLGQCLTAADARCVKELAGPLEELNRLADAVKHDHTKRPTDFERDIKKVYRKFLGIGEEGLLPRLLHVEVKQPPATQP